MFMQGRYIKLVQTVFISLAILLITVSFLNSPGTNDVDIWKRWAITSDTYGPVSGFKINDADYPPFASIILLGTMKVSHLFGGEVFDAVKLSILLFLCLTSFVFWLWTRNFVITVILHLSLLLNSVALGYIDIFFAPCLILSLWTLKERKLTLFTIFFSLACLTKWQPIIIAPFIILYILDIKQVAQWRQIEFKKLFRGVLFPTVVILVVTLSIFGVAEVGQAFMASLSHNYLSGNALNFNWLVTHFLHVFYPDQFGSLVKGQANLIVTTSLKVTLIPKLLFFLSYLITLVSFFKRDKTFEGAITFSLVGYLAYFTFNTGVHENHLFLAAILSIILFWVNRKRLPSMLILLLMSNINLIMFYGMDGGGPTFSRVIGKTIDIALLLSFFNVSFFLFLWGANVLPNKDIDRTLSSVP
jgi:Gpi18-like mannosyltransferase